MKILFFIPTLRAGGAERVASLLANQWQQMGHQVVVVTYDSKTNDFYSLDFGVGRKIIGQVELQGNIISKIWQCCKRIIKLRSVIKKVKPDIVVSFMHMPNVIALLAGIGMRVPVVVSERTTPSYYNNGNMFDYVRKFIYKLSATLVVQTEATAKWARGFLPEHKVVTIANPVKVNSYNEQPSPRENTILAVGRLTPEKGFDMLIEAFKLSNARSVGWKLVIVGGGAELATLQNLIAKYQLTGSVTLAGECSNVIDYYKRASIFVLSSRVEGFPNVLVEAMSHGMAAISFDCASGPSEIIQHEHNGLLVRSGDVAGLAEGMDRLCSDNELLAKFSSYAPKICGKYELVNIADKWLMLFSKLQQQLTKNIHHLNEPNIS